MIRVSSINIPFRYAAGRAGGRFLAALRDEGRIFGTRCPACARILCPARSFCPICGGDTGEWVEVGPGGILVSWTEIPGRGVYGLVHMDGADTALLHLLLAETSTWSIGARVSAVLARERRGSILDIQGFRLAEEGSA